MRYLDLTAPTPAENLAWDEALLDACDAGEVSEVLRVWQSPVRFVVLGYANPLAESVHEAACRAQAVPILRRCSGGGTVLQGPGCLNFAVIVRHDGTGPCASLTGTTQHVMERHREMLSRLLGRRVDVQGRTDLVVADRKVSGNSQRRKRRAALFHGTFLLALDAAVMEALLPLPARQPAYRRGRAHTDFLAALPVQPADLKRALRDVWAAREPLQEIAPARVAQLVRERYGARDWVRLR